MKFKCTKWLLSLVLALAIGFSFSTESSAHKYPRSDGQKTYTHDAAIDVSAEDVEMAAAADKEATTKKFLLHAAKHLDLIVNDEGLDESQTTREIVIFSKAARKSGEEFNSGDTYIIGITKRGAMTNHGLYKTDFYGNRYFDDDNPQMEPIKTLVTAGNLSKGATDPTCKDYKYKNKDDRVACAIRQDTPIGTITTIAGYDHAKDEFIPPDCSALVLSTTAKMVEDETDPAKKKELLQSYVKGVIKAFSDLQLQIEAQVVGEGINPLTPEGQMEVSARTYEKATCFRKDPDLFHGSIYAFIMDPALGISYMNGLDFDFHGLSVSLTDPDPIQCDGANILTAFQNAVTDGSGTVTYHWDDPTVDNDRVEDYLAKGVVPGTSIKQSYLEVVDITGGNAPQPYNLIFGSGIYLDEAEKETCESADNDDGGCAIAATGSTQQSALLNLVLVASVLFPAVFLRKRV